MNVGEADQAGIQVREATPPNRLGRGHRARDGMSWMALLGRVSFALLLRGRDKAVALQDGLAIN